MKVFLKLILRFSLGLILLNWLGFYIVFRIYYKPYEPQEDFSKYNTFLLADSHGAALGSLAEVGIGNFSTDSDSYMDMERKLEYLLRNHKVDRILLTVDGHTLSSYRERASNLDRSIIYVDPTFENVQVSTKTYILDRYLNRYFLPCNSKSRSILIEFFGKGIFKKSTWRNRSNNISQPKGKKNKQLWNEKPEVAEKLELRAERQYGRKSSDKLSASFHRIIETCIQNDVDLIGIRFPIADDYNNLTEHLDFGAKDVLSKRNIKVLDFGRIFKENDEYFRDMDHLNSIGANQLMYLIGEKLN